MAPAMRILSVVAVACVGCVLLAASLQRAAPAELASAAEMREINWAVGVPSDCSLSPC